MLSDSCSNNTKTPLIYGRNAPLFLGSFVCNVQGEKAHLFLEDGNLLAKIHKHNGEVIQLSNHQIKGGKKGEMPSDELIELIMKVAAPLLFVSLKKENTLHICTKELQEIHPNQFLRPRIHLPPNYFACVRREKLLNTLHNLLQKQSIVVLQKDFSLPLKRVGKTEIANQYLKEYFKHYTHTFWIQAFDFWHFEKGLKKMAKTLQITNEQIPDWLSNNSSYLLVIDGVEDSLFIEKTIPKNIKGHLLITTRAPFSNYTPLQIGLLTKKEGSAFLLSHVKGNEEDADRITQALGYVPSSLYRAVETIETEGLTLCSYMNYCESLLEKHAKMVQNTSNLPARNKDFIGREAGLVALEESFSSNKPVVLAANAGMGGVGKTQIALQYAYRTCSNYNLIWWINCGNMESSYDELAKRLKIFLSEEEKREENAILKKVNRYLEKTPGWLLIFDNAENEKSLEGFLPQSGGHILITSRNPNWNQTQAEVFGIEVFKREESVDFLLKVTGLYGQEYEADQLAASLQDLPLALAQASAYIRETGITIEEYIQDFNRTHKALWKREQETNNYECTVNVTWNISMKKIQEEEKNAGIVPFPIALPLMQLCSFFAPNDIPKEALLLKWLEKEYQKKDKGILSCLADLNRTLQLLHKFSMIGLNQANLSLHSLVQTVIRDQLSNHDLQQIFNEAFEIVSGVISLFNRDSVETWNQPKLCVQHAMTLIERETLIKGIDVQQQCNFMLFIGEIYITFGNIKQSLKISQINLVIAENWSLYSLDKQRPHYYVGKSYSNMGLAYQSLGEFEKAIELYQKDLDIQIKIFGDSYFNLAICYNNISEAYFEMGQTDMAFESNNKASDVISKSFGNCHPNYAKTLKIMASICKRRKIYQLSLHFFNLAINTEIQTIGNNHPNLAVTYSSLGEVHQYLKQYSMALVYFQKSLEINLKIFDENHPNIANCYNYIGQSYFFLREYENSLEFNQKALKIQNEKIGEKHPTAAISLHYMGLSNLQINKKEDAFECLQKALEIRISAFGESTWDVSESYNSLALYYERIGENNKALDFYQKVLAIQESMLLGNHEELAETYFNIGRVAFILGKINENSDIVALNMDIMNSTFYYHFSYTMHLTSLGMKLKIYSNDSLEVGQSYYSVARAYNAIGYYRDSLVYYESTLKIFSQTFGEDSPEYVGAYNDFRNCLEKLGNPKIDENSGNTIATSVKSEGPFCIDSPIHEKSLTDEVENLQGRLHKNDNEMASWYNDMGRSYYDLQDFAKALHFFHKALDLLNKLGPDNLESLVVNNNIGVLYLNSGENEKALGYFEKVKSILEKNDPTKDPESDYKMALCLHNIGVIYNNLKNNKALDYLIKSNNLMIKVFGEYNEHVGNGYRCISYAYFLARSFDNALSYGLKAIDIIMLQKGDQPDLIHLYSQLTSIYYELKDYQKCILSEENILNIHSRLYGLEHENIARQYTKIGFYWVLLENYEKALGCHEKALEIRLKNFGEIEPHAEVAESYAKIAHAQNAMGNFEKFLENNNKSIEINLELFLRKYRSSKQII